MKERKVAGANAGMEDFGEGKGAGGGGGRKP